MNLQALNALRAAEDTVRHLVQECRKSGPMYCQCPRAVAQVSRTGKWLLNAITVLRRELTTLAADDGHKAS
jgi:hypothetical protein